MLAYADVCSRDSVIRIFGDPKFGDPNHGSICQHTSEAAEVSGPINYFILDTQVFLTLFKAESKHHRCIVKVLVSVVIRIHDPAQ